jgi:hypothetical protein
MNRYMIKIETIEGKIIHYRTDELDYTVYSLAKNQFSLDEGEKEFPYLIIRDNGEEFHAVTYEHKKIFV